MAFAVWIWKSLIKAAIIAHLIQRGRREGQDAILTERLSTPNSMFANRKEGRKGWDRNRSQFALSFLKAQGEASSVLSTILSKKA